MSVLWEARATLTEMHRASQIFADYSDEQRELLSSPKMKKALEAGLTLPASAQGSIRLLNTTTIPELNATLKELRVTTSKLGTTNDALVSLVSHAEGETLPKIDTLVEHLDTEIVDNLIPQLSAFASELRVSVRDLAIAYVAVAEETQKSEKELVAATKLALANPDIMRFIKAGADTMEHLEETSKELPPTARGIRRWQRPLAIASIVGILGKILVPFP